jgi:hypothetical protein
VTRASGRGDVCDECRQFICLAVRLTFVLVRLDQLIERQVVTGETWKWGVGVEDLERVGVVDEQADRQVGVEFLQQEQVGDVHVRARPPTCRAVRASRSFVQG